jgi:hypothetical protein
MIASMLAAIDKTPSGGWVIDCEQWEALCEDYAGMLPFDAPPDYTPRPTILHGVPVFVAEWLALRAKR